MTGECRKLGVGSLTALVVGRGIFSLPQNIAARVDVGANRLARHLGAVDRVTCWVWLYVGSLCL